MTSSERKYDRAARRASRTTSTICSELRDARVSAGRSQREIAQAARISTSQLARIELGQNHAVPANTLVLIGAMLGLDVVVRTYPGERMLRDEPQLRLMGDLRDRLGIHWRWRFEVLVADNDQRAWDAQIRHVRTGATFVVEAETRIHDIQALLRRVALKREASNGVRVVLLVAGTRNNRLALALAGPTLAAEFPGSGRACWRALADGREPASDTIIVMGPSRGRSETA